MTNRAFLTALAAPCALASGLLASPAHAEAGPLARALGTGPDWTITASIRVRGEAIDGQFRPTGPRSDSAVSIRSTLAVEYDTGPVRIGGEVWDARMFGEAANSTAGTAEVNALEPVQAYVKVELGDWGKGAKGGRGLLTLGRQTMDIGSRRLVARNRFRNTTNAFTGANLEWTAAGGIHAQAFWVMPQARLPDDAPGIHDNRVVLDRESGTLQFYGADLTLPHVLGGTLEAYAFGLAERDAPGRLTRNRRIGTLGGRLFAKPAAGTWDHDVEVAWQFGKTRRSTSATDLADVTVSAWWTHAEAGYSMTGAWHPRFAVLFDAASGDGGKPGRYGRFDTLYGSRRADFGPTAFYGALQRSNIVSPGARVDLTFSKHTDLQATYRALWLEDRRDAFATTGVKDATGASGRFAGHQLDARLRHWLVPGLLQAEAGGVVLIKGGVLKSAPNAPATGDTTYGYIDLSLML
ncbi:alginate export family protein [Novosphingobium cyanobacteriorum]|uniref:Alginate export family protein n=1 Tax=Novosphingobium cyanobacteriorum TaxID=3024215 RepID=A0ABT6CFW4_9SPHN|nr:alginate export family protein [Novosphingobium cyanobacteriorum]MDF8332815.1 alginate export family protein [Novosphingobium cyanobacteriorum]